jgi:hypothetical protein
MPFQKEGMYSNIRFDALTDTGSGVGSAKKDADPKAVEAPLVLAEEATDDWTFKVVKVGSNTKGGNDYILTTISSITEIIDFEDGKEASTHSADILARLEIPSKKDRILDSRPHRVFEVIDLRSGKLDIDLTVLGQIGQFKIIDYINAGVVIISPSPFVEVCIDIFVKLYGRMPIPIVRTEAEAELATQRFFAK